MTLSRSDCLYLARIADQAERYQDVVDQIKSLITSSSPQLTLDERNLLSVAYKNITSTLRSSWRSIDNLEKRGGHSRRQIELMRIEKDGIKAELVKACEDVVELMEKHLVPAAAPGEEKVFYSKMKGDYYRYLAEFSKGGERGEEYANLSLEAYKYAYRHALATLDPIHPTRLGLALNFAVYYHDIRDSPERACFLAKDAFDEAIHLVTTQKTVMNQTLEDSLMILQLLRDDMILWSGEVQQDPKPV
ncbi:14-3-3-like protein [Panus rudis PR-1116 ss-1]|nr:14-3-3-like protein [Panus rudis PR-1116 ss-1]